MKKILLSLGFLIALTNAYSQKDVVINEIYPDPSAGNEEYIELYNTTNATVKLDCYTLVSYYNVGAGGAWVYQLPNVEIEPFGHFVFASDLPINHQGGTYTGANSASWNAAGAPTYSSLTGYTRSGNTLVSNALTTTTDFIPITGGNSTALAIMLFDGAGNLVNAFFANNSNNIPTAITTLTGLPITILSDLASNCGAGATLDFAGISSPEAEVFNLNQAPGNDNGYRRLRDGFCGSWEKAEPASTYSPGEKNSDLPPVDFSTAVDITAVPTGCGDLAGGTESTWNISVQITDIGLLPGSYRIYGDEDHTASLTEADPLEASGAIPTTDVIPLNVAIKKGADAIVQVITASGCIIVTKTFGTECIPLPVKFKIFNANRYSSSSVAITWTTASEDNSKGFNIQRNVGGVWQTIAYVPSQAVNGTSTSELSYNYTDANSLKGITQYRIQQVDLDGKVKYSDIRAIRGDGAAGKVVVYPNPSVDGKVNVVFEDNTAIRDVYVNDMQGRVVKSYKGITNNILVIERLTSGFYTIKITNRNTAASSVEKVVVK